jgi:hypothetical protein
MAHRSVIPASDVYAAFHPNYGLLNKLAQIALSKDDSHRPHENATCGARLEYNDTRVADDANGPKPGKHGPAQEETNKDGSSPRCEGQDNAA